MFYVSTLLKVVVPTSVDWIYENPSHFAAAYVNAACVIYDVETGQEVLQLDTSSVRKK